MRGAAREEIYCSEIALKFNSISWTSFHRCRLLVHELGMTKNHMTDSCTTS